MHFEHSPGIWKEFPDLVAGVLFVEPITENVSVDDRMAPFHATAQSRLAASSEGELPEIQAWRRAFARMGLKPTQYRCSAESLLRRFKKEGSLPRIHPLIDLCNAISLSYAIPMAVIDTAKVAGGLDVRHATGAETYLTFGGETENPGPGEVIFADADDQAHARRWCNRQSGLSAIHPSTTSALIVAEVMHADAARDVENLLATLTDEVNAVWSASAKSAILSESSPRFEF